MKISIDNFIKNAALEAENTSVKADRDNLLAKVKELETKLDDADKTVAAFPLAKQEWDKELMKAKADRSTELENTKKEYQSKIDALTKELASTKESVNKEVVNALGSVGIQAGTVKEETISQSNEVTKPKSRFRIDVLK